MLGKIMWVAGIGLVFGCAVKAVQAVKEEQDKINEIHEKDGEEPISFVEAAKAKVAKISHKTLMWAVNHIQDIQGISLLLGIAVPIVEILVSFRQERQFTKLNGRLDKIELRVGESCGIGYANNFGINTIAYKTDAINLPKEVLSMLHDETLKLMN